MNVGETMALINNNNKSHYCFLKDLATVITVAIDTFATDDKLKDMDIVDTLVTTVMNGFDLHFCVTVNLMTYCLVTMITGALGKDIKRVWKRLILFVSIIILGILYYLLGVDDVKVIIDSSVLAPVSWSWIIKPIFNKLGLDYKQIDKRFN